MHFTDAAVPQALALWIFFAKSGTAYNVPGRGDVLGVGLKHDSDTELDRQANRFRIQGGPFRWARHVDSRYEGYRLIENADRLHAVADQTATDEVVRRVMDALHNSNMVAR